MAARPYSPSRQLFPKGGGPRANVLTPLLLCVLKRNR
jgi:hypothetical protein